MRYSRKLNLKISVDISNICDIHRYLVRYLECIQSLMNDPGKKGKGMFLTFAVTIIALAICDWSNQEGLPGPGALQGREVLRNET